MTDIQIPKKYGRKNWQQTSIDFTPMVDLGFLLITFFIVTTTMVKPRSLVLDMPSDEGNSTVWADESTVTLIPVKNHNVIYYMGSFNPSAPVIVMPLTGLRFILLGKKKAVGDLPLSFSVQAHKLHVLIKPNDDCKYEDVVFLLDEMSIVAAPFYAIADISPEEMKWIPKY